MVTQLTHSPLPAHSSTVNDPLFQFHSDVGSLLTSTAPRSPVIAALFPSIPSPAPRSILASTAV